MKRSSNGNDFKDYEDSPKRKFKVEDFENDGRGDKDASDKVADYVRDLKAEKSELDESKLRNAVRLVDEEIKKVENLGRIPPREYKYVNIYREKPIKVTTKVSVPAREHPKFNFVGKLLGPKGNSLKRLQEETMCKMSILGKGSMKDPQKEEELKASDDPKYAHLSEDLHVEISAFGPPAEAHARMSFALAEIRKYMIPDKNDTIRQEQFRELETISGPNPGAPRSSYRGPGMLKTPRAPIPRPPVMMRTATRAPVVTPRVMPAKVKIMSILDRARAAMEESYGYDEPVDAGDSYGAYDAPLSPAFQQSRYTDSEYPSENYYRKSSSQSYEDPSHRWKPSPPVISSRQAETRYRPASYSRPSLKEPY